MIEPPNFEHPDETVANQIITRFVAAGLLSQQDMTYAKAQLANGTLRAEDWRLLAEKALELAIRERAGE